MLYGMNCKNFINRNTAAVIMTVKQHGNQDVGGCMYAEITCAIIRQAKTKTTHKYPDPYVFEKKTLSTKTGQPTIVYAR